MKEPNMRLWLLRPIENLGPDEENYWDPWYDCAFGFVIRATTEERARQLALTEQGSERGYSSDPNSKYYTHPSPWLDPHYTTCVELRAEGPETIILLDFHSA